MISWRKADLIDRLKPEGAKGETKFHLTFGSDINHNGNNIYFLTTDTGGGDWDKCNDAFQEEVENILEGVGFLYVSYGEWIKYLPTPLYLNELTHYIDGFFDGLLLKLKEGGFFASITMEGGVTNTSLQVDVWITKGISQYKKADLIDRIKSDGIDLIFEKGYMIAADTLYDTYQFDCKNGRDIPGATLVPPIKSNIDRLDRIYGPEFTKLTRQLSAWNYEVIGLKYNNDKQQIIFKVKKKS